MKTYKHLYNEICSYENLLLAYKRAKKGKSKKDYVSEYAKEINVEILDASGNGDYRFWNASNFVIKGKKFDKFGIEDYNRLKIG